MKLTIIADAAKKLDKILAQKARETVSGPKPSPFKKEDIFKQLKIDRDIFDKIFRIAVASDVIKKHGKGSWVYNGHIA
jgi:hypothetical protein